MDIDWREIYRSNDDGRVKKFVELPRIIPWGSEFEENITITLEWLLRDGRNDDIRYSKEPTVNFVRDNWYRAEFEEGRFLHCCYPQDLLKFRGQYEMIINQIKELDEINMLEIKELADNARSRLWSAWNCFGGDGEKQEPKVEKFTDDLQFIPSYQEWPRVWSNSCKKCCDPLPKALQIWVKFQHSKLKDAK